MRFSYLVAFVGCLACSASVNPALKSNIDRVVSVNATGDATHQAPEADQPMPLAVGQWSRYKTTDKDNKPGLMTYKIVGQQGNAHWLETVQETYYNTQVTLILAELGARKDVSDFQVLRIKQKVGDQAPTEMPQNMLGMMAGIWKPVLKTMVVDWQDQPQQDAHVPAGTFSQCYQVNSTVSLLGMTQTSRNWSHPAVPLSGLVRSESVDASFTMELLEFGLQGAESTIGID